MLRDPGLDQSVTMAEVPGQNALPQHHRGPLRQGERLKWTELAHGADGGLGQVDRDPKSLSQVAAANPMIRMSLTSIGSGEPSGKVVNGSPPRAVE